MVLRDADSYADFPKGQKRQVGSEGGAYATKRGHSTTKAWVR